MSIKVRVVPKDGASSAERFTFPQMDADLEDDSVDELEMREALVRFGKKLAEQHPTAVGVELHSIGFTYILPVTVKEHVEKGCAKCTEAKLTEKHELLCEVGKKIDGER